MPKSSRASSTPRQAQNISEQLRQFILDRNLTGLGLHNLTAEHFGLDDAVPTAGINRFLAGQRDIRLETAAKLAEVLNLRLAEFTPARKPGRPKARKVSDRPEV